MNHLMNENNHIMIIKIHNIIYLNLQAIFKEALKEVN